MVENDLSPTSYSQKVSSLPAEYLDEVTAEKVILLMLTVILFSLLENKPFLMKKWQLPRLEDLKKFLLPYF